MLSKPNPCEGFGKGWKNRKVYEANGCNNKEDCKNLDGDQDRKLNRRIQLAVYLNDNGIMHYQLGVKCINGDSARIGCHDDLIKKTPSDDDRRRRRLLVKRNGGGRC